MDRPITNRLRITFLLHWIISAILGAALWLIPGRTLTLLGWVGETVGFLPYHAMACPGDNGDCDGERCYIYDEDGACHKWAQYMANDAGVPIRWLVDMILDGYIDSDWSVS